MPPRRPQSKQKLPNKQAIQKKPLVVEDDTEAVEKFKVELQWCVQQIEAAMKKASLKDKEDMAKAHRTLTSSKAAHIKKRQVMNSLFGDYRAKMAQEETKMKTEAPKMKKRSTVPTKSLFLKKSADHLPRTTSGPSANSQGAGEEIQAAKDIDPKDSDLSGAGSSSALDTEEMKENSGEGISSSERNVIGDLSKDNVGESQKIASGSFKFPTQSGNTFKFNFSSVS